MSFLPESRKKNFLKQEKITREEIYSNEYERSVESLKKWTDGYTALMVSVTLVITITLVSVMIYNITNMETIAFLIEILTLFICGLPFTLYIKQLLPKKSTCPPPQIKGAGANKAIEPDFASSRSDFSSHSHSVWDRTEIYSARSDRFYTSDRHSCYGR
ncbi:hypothetical protein [Methanosarcina horonobensis]|uniref:hypothetical protein n=1 Tax=Methanosarcina horonobensis TaxID=418008 RepID=UPI000AF18D94|nr:hypothetical protein [Methanosarcina horonobensis]